jgi:hypothetical protein
MILLRACFFTVVIIACFALNRLIFGFLYGLERSGLDYFGLPLLGHDARVHHLHRGFGTDGETVRMGNVGGRGGFEVAVPDGIRLCAKYALSTAGSLITCSGVPSAIFWPASSPDHS